MADIWNNQIDTEKPVEKIIYDKWEDFFEEIDLTSFGQYRCENESDLLSTLNLIKENKDDKLKYLLNQNQHDDYCFWNETNLDKKVTFFNPAKFLSLMEKILTPLEFNPYEKYRYLSPRHPDTTIKAEYVAHHNSKIEVISNPGFAPASSSNSDSKRFPYEYNGLYYGAVNWCYYCSIYPHVTKSGNPHTGIDFAGYEGTPIYSFIQGEVWATSFMGNMINGVDNGGKCYCRMMLIKGNINRLYLLGHLSAYNKNKGDSVMPGDIVAYVGNTGNSAGAHLHVEVFECDNNLEEDSIINTNASETIEMKWIDNKIYWDKTDKRVNPFNH